MIDGGWGYVWAAYGITWVVVLGYALSLLRRVRPGAAPPRPGALADTEGSAPGSPSS